MIRADASKPAATHGSADSDRGAAMHIAAPGAATDTPYGVWPTYDDYSWVVLDSRTWRCAAGPFEAGTQARAAAEQLNLKFASGKR